LDVLAVDGAGRVAGVLKELHEVGPQLGGGGAEGGEVDAEAHRGLDVLVLAADDAACDDGPHRVVPLYSVGPCAGPPAWLPGMAGGPVFGMTVPLGEGFESFAGLS